MSLLRKRYERGVDAERRQDLDAAVAHFENLVADPCGVGECPDARLRLGRLYARRRDPARAVETLAKALESAPGALEERMLLLEQYRDLFLIERATGPRHARQKLVVRGYRGRAERDPSHANLFDLGYLHALGLDPECDRAGNVRAAVSAWERCLALGDADGLTLKHLAGGYAWLGRWPEARRAAEKLVALAPRDGEALDQLADAWDACGDREAADRVRWQRVDLEPDRAAGWVRLVEAWAARGRPRDDDVSAIVQPHAELAREVERRGTTPAGQVALGWAHLAICEGAPGEDEAVRALARFEEAQEAAPDEPFGWWGAARAHAILVAAGRTTAAPAIEACEEPARRHPSLARAHLELGEALMLAPAAPDRDEAARAAFTRARDLEPQDARPHLRLAELARATGATDEACVHARRALALAADPERAAMAAALLESLTSAW